MGDGSEGDDESDDEPEIQQEKIKITLQGKVVCFLAFLLCL